MKQVLNLPHILLVEDDEIDQETVRRAFNECQILNPLHVAYDGVDAMAMLTGPEKLDPLPKIMLLDINMPRMNGLQLLANIRKFPELNQMMVIVLTTSDAEKDIVAAYNDHVAGYILKPVNMQDFIKVTSQLKVYWSMQLFPNK